MNKQKAREVLHTYYSDIHRINCGGLTKMTHEEAMAEALSELPLLPDDLEARIEDVMMKEERFLHIPQCDYSKVATSIANELRRK